MGAEIISHIAQMDGNYKVTVNVLAESETKNGNISIKIVTQRLPNPADKSRIEAESLFQAASDLVGTDSDLSKKKYAQSAIIWRQLNEKYWLVLALVGVYSTETLEEAVGIYQELGDKTNAKNLYGVLGNYYKGEKEFDKAILRFERGLVLAKETQDTQEIATFEKQIKETQNLKIFQKADVIFAEAVLSVWIGFCIGGSFRFVLKVMSSASNDKAGLNQET